MFIAVIVTVVILVLLVSGYWLNENLQVERNGMLQISSFPTGADVEIDGETSSWLERTNSSKILSSGEHSVTLTKDGYDSWSKTINISEGLLYRLHYPRLFLNQREISPVLDTAKYTSATISANHNVALLINNTTEWAYLNLDADDLKPRSLDISKIFTTTPATDADSSAPGLFTGTILQADWDVDASHVLFQVKNDDAIEWVLLDVDNIDKSINLTREFGANFSRIEILDNNSNNLLAIQDHNLRKIDISSRLISAILVENVFDFDHYHNEIVFSTTNNANTASTSDTTSITDTAHSVDAADSINTVGYFKLGDSNLTKLTTTATPAKVAISKFYDSKYITIIEGQNISVHPKDSFNEPDSVSKYTLTFTPESVEVGHGGEFLLLTAGHQLATLDMEAKLTLEWTIENDFGWLDQDMLYTVADGELIVYDFDGLNRRVLAHDVSGNFPVAITSDKWLYYFSNHNLVREWLISR
ncbi:PEGA domain-containing protein [Candidatus Saccharibacteria bacterium]|nr:PEGA domain-containing protein [Candidatus Saccharibacteria bacterium]